ncbi:MAG: hypothetical protein ACKOXO_05480 [Cyanobium sp.]
MDWASDRGRAAEQGEGSRKVTGAILPGPGSTGQSRTGGDASEEGLKADGNHSRLAHQGGSWPGVAGVGDSRRDRRRRRRGDQRLGWGVRRR